MKKKSYFVYIMGSLSGTLYTGITSRLTPRAWEHKNKVNAGFTAKYDVDRLLYYEQYSSVISAITREKQIKGMRRSKKIALIQSINPSWKDLSREWFESLSAGRDSSPAARNDASNGKEQVRP
jgi:putative endonuclease